MNALDMSTAGGRGRIGVTKIAAIVFVVAAIVGAYLDWLWWANLEWAAFLITLAAGAILVVGGIVALVAAVMGREIARRIILIALAVGVGLVAGQKLGPSREPLILHSNGTMTLRLESPIVEVATSSAACWNVASATEFRVWGSPSLITPPDRPSARIDFNLGDRWRAAGNAPRKDGVRLFINIDPSRHDVSVEAPMSIGMQATNSSTLASTFTNEGGSIRFSDLEALSGPGFSGESMDLAGTIEWTCGAASP